jgi:hypothetical protein
MEKRKPTAKDWEKIKVLYLKGEKPKNIVEKFKTLEITARQITRKFSANKITDKKRQIETKTQEILENDIIQEKTEANKRHIALYDEGLDIVEKLLKAYKENALQGKKRGVNPFNLEKIFSCIEKAQKGQRLALNIDAGEAENDEPEICIIDGLNITKI